MSKDSAHIRHWAPIYNKTPDALHQQIERVQKMSSKVQAADEAVSQKTEAQKTPLQSVLICYVDMAIEQSRLVEVAQSKKLGRLEGSRDASAKAVSHSKTLNAYASKIVEYLEVKLALRAMKGNKPASLADRGGFVAIRERALHGVLARDDVPTVLLHLKARHGNIASYKPKSKIEAGAGRVARVVWAC